MTGKGGSGQCRFADGTELTASLRSLRLDSNGGRRSKSSTLPEVSEFA